MPRATPPSTRRLRCSNRRDEHCLHRVATSWTYRRCAIAKLVALRHSRLVETGLQVDLRNTNQSSACRAVRLALKACPTKGPMDSALSLTQSLPMVQANPPLPDHVRRSASGAPWT